LHFGPAGSYSGMHALAAATIAVSGVDGFLEIVAVLCFLIAAIIAWFVEPRARWATLVAAGLLFWILTLIVK
jgi:hypothetical protein